jgi:CBS domain-containing protein
VQVSEIMQTDLVTCPPTATVAEAARTMRDRNVGAVLVMEGSRLAGIFTERDLVHLLADGGEVAARPVSAVMTRDVAMVPADADISWAAEQMKQRRVRHLPIGDAPMVVGMISVRDLFVLAEAVLRLDPDGAVRAQEMLQAASG